MQTQQKAKSQLVGLTVYLLAQCLLPGLKLAHVAQYSWWVATSLFWGPVLLLAAAICCGVIIKAFTGRR